MLYQYISQVRCYGYILCLTMHVSKVVHFHKVALRGIIMCTLSEGTGVVIDVSAFS